MQKINIENAQQDNYQVRESYRNLRTNIFLSGKDTKVVMFTSCGPNEGKSTVTMNLASSIADGGKKVLFIDCDLRKSVLVGRYRVKKGIKGLTHFLSGQNTLEEVIYSTNVENMDVILAGPVPPNPAELLDSPLFKDTVKEMREKYDYVIIDTPPLGSVIDAAIVASNAETEITTSYGKFTVAGAISLRSRLRGLGTYDGEADFEGILMLGIIIHQG